MIQKKTVKIDKQAIFQLILAFIGKINLNHIVCSLSNIFMITQWKDRIKFDFNYTSIAFIFDIYKRKSICKADMIQYGNYLVPSLFTTQSLEEQFNYCLKIRSLAINLLSIVLQRQISFFKKYQIEEYYSFQQCQKISLQNNHYFSQFLNHQKIRSKINQTSELLNIDLLNFFKITIIHYKSVLYQKLGSWAKIISYFKLQFLNYYSNIFQLQFQSEHRAILNNPSSKSSYLNAYVAKMWSQDNSYLRNQFISLGIVDPLANHQLILYLLYKFNLNNFTTYSFGKNVHHPQFLKLVIKLYNQIIQSSLMLDQAQSIDLNVKITKRNQSLSLVVIRLNAYLTQLSCKTHENKDKILYVAKQKIDMRQLYQSCWHSNHGAKHKE